MTWALGQQADENRYLEYEALLNHLLAVSKVVMLCQYNYARFAAPSIHDVFRTHPLIILGDQICLNSYYEPPEMVLSEDQAVMTPEYKARRVDWWIAQLKRARTAEQERERTLERLQISERRLAEAQQVAQIGSWERDLRTDQVTWSAQVYRLFGLPVQEGPITFQTFMNLVPPEEQERIRVEVKEVVAEGRPFNCDYHFRRADGSLRVMNDRGSLILNEGGQPVRLVGTVQDVTELRRAEQASQEYAVRLQALSRRLLEVQEAERRHLARELHDEFGQILATITLHLHAARSLAGAAARPRLEECVALLQQAGEHVRSLALELRPSMLDILGLEASLRWLAENYQQRTSLQVQIVGHLSGSQLPPTLAIACFRVVQEALTNVVRHAGAGHVWIDLNQSDNVVEISIRDDGAGFDVVATQEEAIQRGRLGLLGMAERVQLFGGRLDIESARGRGTQIRFSLPWNAASEPEE
jgi:two-component system sensor histidine kinase UhpB